MEINKLKCQVLLLDTKDKTSIVYIGDWKKLHYDKDAKDYQYLSKDESYQHLYFTSTGEIKEGDYYLCLNEISRCKDGLEAWITIKGVGKYDCFKIEATTDTVLSKEAKIPLIPISFIEELVSRQGQIKDVCIETENFDRNVIGVFRIKTNSNNECIVSFEDQIVLEEEDLIDAVIAYRKDPPDKYTEEEYKYILNLQSKLWNKEKLYTKEEVKEIADKYFHQGYVNGLSSKPSKSFEEYWNKEFK